MCETQAPVFNTAEPVIPVYLEAATSGPLLTRRHLLQMAGALGMSIMGSNDQLWLPDGPLQTASPENSAVPTSELSGYKSTSFATHVHASFSEGSGSVESQVDQARRTGVDAIIFTEHDWRMIAQGAPDVIGFDAGGAETDRYGNKPWAWLQDLRSQSLPVASAELVSDVYSPNDQAIPGSLHVRAVSAKGQSGSNTYLGYDNDRTSHRVNLSTIKQLSIDVLPTDIGSNAWMEVRIMLSNRPATGDRPAGQYELRYRLGAAGGDGMPGPSEPMYPLPNGISSYGGVRSDLINVGVVTKAVQAGTWNTVELDLVSDITKVWPDLKYPADNSFADVRVGVTSVDGHNAEGYFDNLQTVRDVADNRPMEAMRVLLNAIGLEYPEVSTFAGREISYGSLQHVNAFGDKQQLFDYRALAGNAVGGKLPDTVLIDQISAMHASGGVTSFGHPFGVTTGGLLSPSRSAIRLRNVAEKCLNNGLYGSDILETGYVSRGGEDIWGHLALANTLFRNGVFMTMNGVSDDHSGMNWDTMINHMRTQVLSDPDQPVGMDQFVTAMKRGNAIMSQIKSFDGLLDIQLDDGMVKMGQVSVLNKSQRRLQVAGAKLPKDGVIKIVQVPIDYAGNVPTGVPFTSASIQTNKLNRHSVWETIVDTSKSSAIYVMCLTKERDTTVCQAITNPVFALREMPPATAPYARAISQERLAAHMLA